MVGRGLSCGTGAFYVILLDVKVVNIHEADLSRLIEEALAGEEIVIARGNEPVVRLVLVESARPQRSVGWARGLVALADDFDAPLDDFAD
jgi:antitoxin (DNA-binding transcriptional repressor) of toxin-antitoxin stability system